MITNMKKCRRIGWKKYPYGSEFNAHCFYLGCSDSGVMIYEGGFGCFSELEGGEHSVALLIRTLFLEFIEDRVNNDRRYPREKDRYDKNKNAEIYPPEVARCFQEEIKCQRNRYADTGPHTGVLYFFKYPGLDRLV